MTLNLKAMFENTYFTFFQNPKRDILRFFALLHTFSRTMPEGVCVDSVVRSDIVDVCCVCFAVQRLVNDNIAAYIRRV